MPKVFLCLRVSLEYFLMLHQLRILLAELKVQLGLKEYSKKNA